MQVEANKASIRGFIANVLNGGDIDAAGQYFHDEMVELDPFPGQGPGLAGLKATLRALRAAFPDMHWAVEEQIGEGEKVVTRFTFSGTHGGEFLGLTATGRPVSVGGVVIDEFVGGKVKNSRILMNMLAMLQQLGAVPS